MNQIEEEMKRKMKALLFFTGMINASIGMEEAQDNKNFLTLSIPTHFNPCGGTNCKLYIGTYDYIDKKRIQKKNTPDIVNLHFYSRYEGIQLLNYGSTDPLPEICTNKPNLRNIKVFGDCSLHWLIDTDHTEYNEENKKWWLAFGHLDYFKNLQTLWVTEILYGSEGLVKFFFDDLLSIERAPHFKELRIDDEKSEIATKDTTLKMPKPGIYKRGENGKIEWVSPVPKN